MPIYEYLCARCGEFEVTQRITEEPLKRCPTCRSKVKKLISNTSFQLKGSGWYVTDYGRKGDGSGQEAGGSANGAGETAVESGASDKKEVKPEAKKEGEKAAKKDTKKDTKKDGSAKAA